MLRGASSHILEEADRSLHDALCVLSETVSDVLQLLYQLCMQLTADVATGSPSDGRIVLQQQNLSSHEWAAAALVVRGCAYCIQPM